MSSETPLADMEDVNRLRIGLVNNMPDSALETTERQFRALLSEAAEGVMVELRLFALPYVPRSVEVTRRMDGYYRNLHALWDDCVDGLIVTGAEPVAADLVDEPFWDSLARLVDWARHNTYSSVWSCLAAHAAVLRLDGIRRRRLEDKLFGVFECAKVSEHDLIRCSPELSWRPHSRWNDIPEEDLSACGYTILTRLNNGLVDTFVKRCNSLFVCLQGHPEYEDSSLLLEYRRDIRRYWNKERELCPTMPEGYFDEPAASSKGWIQGLANPCELDVPDFSSFPQAARVKHSWHSDAVRLYRNWLHYLSEQKAMSLDNRLRRTGHALSTGPGVACRGVAQQADAG